MSTLLYTPLTSASHPWIVAPNRAFKITAGAHVDKVIQISITKTQEDVDLDGVPEQLNAKFTGCIVDETTGAPLDVQGTEIITNSEVHTLVPNSESTVLAAAQVAGFMADNIDLFIHKTIRKEMTLIAWHQF